MKKFLVLLCVTALACILCCSCSQQDQSEQSQEADSSAEQLEVADQGASESSEGETSEADGGQSASADGQDAESADGQDDQSSDGERGEDTSASKGIVCIDAGHSDTPDYTQTPIGPGSDEMQPVEPGGTSGATTGTPEYEVTMEVSDKLKDELQARGYEVVMVRESDDTGISISSEERAAVANDAGADLFLRLHCDGSEDSSSAGFSTLVPGYSDWTADIVESSREAAEIMHPIIIEETGATDAGIVERTDLAGFNFCEVPVVLYEMGFLTNPEEEALLIDDDYQATMAQAMADAVDAYFASK